MNVAIVDNAGLVISESIIDETHTAEEILISKNKENLKSSLVKMMTEKKYFNEVKLYPYPVRTDKKYGEQIPLIKSDVQSIAASADADAIISLDIFYANNNERREYYYGETFKMNTTREGLLFRIYNREGELVTPAMLASDSIKWTDSGKFNLLEIYDALTEEMVEGMVAQLIPYWTTEERAYYTDGTKEMKEAHKLVEQGKWEEAAVLWGKAFDEGKNDKQKARIAANIALANENLDDIENAVVWIGLASDLIGKDSRSEVGEYIKWYKGRLSKREINYPVVLDQLGITSDSQ